MRNKYTGKLNGLVGKEIDVSSVVTEGLLGRKVKKEIGRAHV